MRKEKGVWGQREKRQQLIIETLNVRILKGKTTKYDDMKEERWKSSVFRIPEGKRNKGGGVY